MKEEYVDHEYVLAEPERIWDILADVDDWSHELGGHRCQMTVAESDRPRRLVLLGRSHGLTSRHEWELTPAATGTCEVVTKDTISGWMLPLTHPLIGRRVAKDDARWLTYLTRRAEGRWVERPPAKPRPGVASRWRRVKHPLPV